MNKTIIILHGWGKSGNDYYMLRHLLEKKGYTVFAPDMPGFGKEQLKKTMTVNDYVVFIKEFLEKKNIKKAIVIGHSFGGRVAAKFAATYPKSVEKLVLTGAPLIKQPLPPFTFFVSLLVKPAKSLTSLFPAGVQQMLRKGLYRSIGEWDYYKSAHLKETFRQVIAEDLLSYLPRIAVSTVVIWGGKDTFVPLAVGKQIAKIIPHATLLVVPDVSHKLPYENPKIFAQKVLSSLS